MRWTSGPQSDDLEDRRGEGGGGGSSFGGMRGLGAGGVIILVILSVVFKRDFFSLVGATGDAPVATGSGPVQSSAAEDSLVKFVNFVLTDVQSFWEKTLPASGVQYRHAKLDLFRDAIESACGNAQAATGPFYCPSDEKVYVDLGFFQELKDRFGAPGDFAQAYVLAHEFGHHVQKLLGTEAKVREAQQSRPGAANALSVRMELQADCYAGVWGKGTAGENVLEPGDVDEGLRAAASVGDDRLQKMATGRVSPESFTHGTSAQRMDWFKRGFESGRIGACDTFAAAK